MARVDLLSGPHVEMSRLALSCHVLECILLAPGGIQQNNEAGPCKAETADGKDDFCSGGQGPASIWIPFIAPQRALFFLPGYIK